jgi:hypothetical protein
LHNLLIDSSLRYLEYDKIDITEYVEYFENMAAHFQRIAEEFTDLDLYEDSIKEDAHLRVYSKMMSDAIRSKKKS